MSKLITPSKKLYGGGNYNIPQKNGEQSSQEVREKAEKLMKASEDPDINMILKDPDEEKLRESLKNFIEEDIPESAKYVELLSEAHVVCKLFRHSEIKNADVVNPMTGEKGFKKEMILPYVKVIVAHKDSDVSEGDILVAPDDISVMKMNPEYLDWYLRTKNERPIQENPGISKVIGRILDWRETSMFVVDKENPTEEDLWTFYRPLREFRARINKDKFLK